MQPPSTHSVAPGCRAVVKYCSGLDLMPTSALHAPFSLQDAMCDLFTKTGLKSHSCGVNLAWTRTKGAWLFLKIHLCACAGVALAIRLVTADARAIAPLLSRRNAHQPESEGFMIFAKDFRSYRMYGPGGRRGGRKCLLHHDKCTSRCDLTRRGPRVLAFAGWCVTVSSKICT